MVATGPDLAAAIKEIRPQPGPQELFLSTPADIGIIGGSVYGGKTWALVVEPLRHVHVPGFTFVFFRRVTPMIKNPGGVWDESMKWYDDQGGEPKSATLEWDFPSGARGKMSGLQYDSDVLDWKSAQICVLLFDQLEEFSEHQFFYMLSRNRSLCGIRPYIRASCNPDPDSFLASFVSWWIDEMTGYAIPERSGVVRWFVRINDVLQWSETTCRPDQYPDYATIEATALEELGARFGALGKFAKSVTFVLARLQDNKIGVELDPGYEANVRAMSHVEQERLLGGDRGGNWKIRAAAGKVFNRGWFDIVDAVPADVKWIRGWDKAYTAGDGDLTSGTKIGHSPSTKLYYVGDNVSGQWGAGERESTIKNTAKLDGVDCDIYVWQDPAAGKDSVNTTIENLAGFNIRAEPARRDKLSNANPFAAQAQAGNVKIVRGLWNEQYLKYLHAFPTKGVPDDDVDSSSLAFNKHNSAIDGLIDYYEQQAAALAKRQQERANGVT